MFDSADWYERSINWSARLAREIPVLTEVLGPAGRVLDAGCGTGHQASALAQRGYQVTGADASEEMLAVARRTAAAAGTAPRFACVPYGALHLRLGGDFDGVYCIGNALAAAGSRHAAAEALAQFAACLRRGGRLFVQILNFAAMRDQHPCVHGPRVSHVDGREYVSLRHFRFAGEIVEITHITLWNEGGWKKYAQAGRLCDIDLETLRGWCDADGLRVDALWGSYDREPLDLERSVDLILVATRT
ncbi:MAG: class I SAM-dependent methyltransferase [Planctomycetes bacterium]|nr:class I SAM-dependent methyltransferase [Planctomycetota bacterium]